MKHRNKENAVAVAIPSETPYAKEKQSNSAVTISIPDMLLKISCPPIRIATNMEIRTIRFVYAIL